MSTNKHRWQGSVELCDTHAAAHKTEAIGWIVDDLSGLDPIARLRRHNAIGVIFQGSELFLLPGAQHFVQLDEPEQVARLILAMPGPGSTPPAANKIDH